MMKKIIPELPEIDVHDNESLRYAYGYRDGLRDHPLHYGATKAWVMGYKDALTDKLNDERRKN